MGTDRVMVNPFTKDPRVPLLGIDSRIVSDWRIDSDDSVAPDLTPGDFWECFYSEVLSEFEDAEEVGEYRLFRDFFLGMIASDPKNRLSTQQLLRHPYLADVPFCNELISS